MRRQGSSRRIASRGDSGGRTVPRNPVATRRVVAAVAVAAVAVGAIPSTSWAAGPPEHDGFVAKDIALTIPPLPGCPAGDAASIDLVFNEQFHAVFTDETWHGTSTLAGTFTTRDGSGDAIASGHFVSRSSLQLPGFPLAAITEVVKATGKTVDGERVSIRLLSHLTINAQDEVVREFERADCG
jgi:hypothetical protein